MTPVWDIAVHLVVADGIFDGVLVGISDLTESVFDGFPYYSSKYTNIFKMTNNKYMHRLA